MARRLLKVVIANPEAIENASERFTKMVYEAYKESLSKKENFRTIEKSSNEEKG